MLYSRSPLCVFSCTLCKNVIRVGENTQGRFCNSFNSRSPPMNRNCVLFKDPIFDPILCTFKRVTFCHGLSAVVWYT